MALIEHVTLSNTVQIASTAEAVWNFFANLETNYKRWHPQDHVSCRWIKGRPHEVGSIVEAVETLAGKARTIRMTCVDVVPNKRIEYRTGFPLSLFHPSSTYLIGSDGAGTVRFTAIDRFRFPAPFRRFLAPLLAITDQHIKEEGTNLKRLLEEMPSSASAIESR